MTAAPDLVHDPVAAELAKRAARAALPHPDPGNRRPPRFGWRRLVDAVTWPVAFLLDRNDRPATSKVMAFAILVAFAIGKTVPVTVVLALLAASFGYTAWKDFVAKGSWGATSTDAIKLDVARIERIDHTITETRGPTGEPMKSLPPLPDARTPSGDE